MKQQLIRALAISMFLFSVSCANKVEVPTKVEQCFIDPETGECTNKVYVEVKHTITIELPTIFTDTCKKKFNETDYPDKEVRDAGYEQCIADYMDDLINIINSLNPEDVANVPPL